MERSDTYYMDMAEDAMQTAYELGYRPCDICGCWHPKSKMTASTDDEGLDLYYCQACTSPLRDELRHD